MATLKRTFSFGKVDYLRHGCKNCAVEVTMEYRDKGNGKKTLSICGDIWNTRHTDIYCGGQCLDTIAEYVHSPLFKKVYRLWKLYHLNDMHAECVHQHELGWHELAKKEVPLYIFTLTSDAIRQRNELKQRAMELLKSTGSASIAPEERKCLSLEYQIESPVDSLPPNFASFYELKEVKHEKLGWLNPDKHPDGLLGKPCPVCGYKYGSAWNHFPIPEEDEKFIYELLGASDAQEKEGF